MKKISKNVFLVFLSVLAFASGTIEVSSQNKSDEQRNIKRPPSLRVFDASKNYNSQNTSQLLQQEFKFSPQTSFQYVNQNQDPLGFSHDKYQQYYNGIKVEFSTFTLHSKAGVITSMTNSLTDIKELNTTPSLGANQAFNYAIAKVGASRYLWQNEQESQLANYEMPQGELVIFPVLENVTKENRLAYKFDIYATEPLYRADVYVDAVTGEILLENKKIHHANVPASGNSLYNGNVSFTADNASGPYRLRQTADGNGIQTYDMNNGTNYNSASDITSGSTSFNHPTGVQAHFGAEKTHQYFSSKHNRNSYNNAGAIIRSYVSYSNNYVNAFWDGSRMTYGDGDGVNYGPLVSLDIVGHEITHGVTEYSANLVYSYQSGALNESFSDIFGESIENYASGSNDWLMGDQIGAGGSGGALRSMSNPNAYGDPDTYLGTNWYSGAGDNGGVHYNSGVQNFWFYLLTVGGSGTNDNGDSYTVAGIGMDKAAAIAYRNLAVYLSTNSQYSDARNGAIQAAIDLYGAGSAEEIATTNAWYAVGVGAAYGGGGGGSYCSSTSTNVNDEYISRVQLNTINNASGAQFYSDFTAISTNLNEGQSYTITVTPTWTGTVYAEGYAVWIDYNDDKDFNDAGELVWSKAASTNTPNSGSFTVPSGTSGNSVRMRVSMKYNGIPTACETFTYGEVEDYTVNLVAGGDTQPPSNPTNLSASNVTNTTVDLSWNASTDNVGVTGYEVFLDGSSIGSVAGTSANVTGLTAATSYAFNVRAFDAAGNNSGFSNTVNVTTTGGGGGGGCTGGISSFPYAESFESGLGAWTQSTADDIDWTRDSGGTPSSNTGPSSGSNGSWYMYVEASSPNYPSKRAILNSPCFNLSSAASATFTFNYHMYGASDMGSIALEVSNNNGASWTTVWSETGNKGNTWLTANINLSAYVGGSIQLRFNRLTGSTWQADIAIDYVRMTTGGGGSGCAGGVSLPYSESFESGLGAWTQSTSDDINWTRDSGGTPSRNTGPSSGASGSWYMYVEASSPNYPNKRAILNSPCFDLSSASTATFNFSYHMYGASDMGTFALEVSGDNGASWASVWSQTGNQGNAWRSASVSLTPYIGGGVQLRFNRVTGSTWQADIAIDNISVTSTNNVQGILGNEGQLSLVESELNIYPNPVKGNILNVEVNNASPTNYIISNVLGQIIMKGDFTDRIDVSILESGMYLLQVNTETGKLVERFIKE